MDRKFGILKLKDDRSGFVLLTSDDGFCPDVSFEDLAHWENPEFIIKEVVTFTLIPDGEPGMRSPQNILKATEDNDPNVLQQCFYVNDPGIWKRVAARYLAQLDAFEQVQAIIQKLNKLKNSSYHLDSLVSLLSEEVVNSAEAAPLQSYVEDMGRKDIIPIPDVSSEQLNKVSPEVHANEIDISFLFGSTKEEILCSTNYPEFGRIADPQLKFAGFKVSTIDNQLTSKDRELASLWAMREKIRETNNSTYARMLSARMAEKATALFFHNLGFPVKDVAIQQIDGGEDWCTHDLLVNGKAIDVKNARKPYNGNNTYVKHFIPQFKHDRNLEEVAIFGVLSPYLQLSYQEPNKFDLLDDNYVNKSWQPEPKFIQMLGITNESYIKKLETDFKTSVLTEIEIEHCTDNSGLQEKTIPGWVFEFPTKYYKQRNQSLSIIQRLNPAQIPSASLLKSNNEKPPIAAFVAAGRRPPDDWLATLLSWKVQFIDQLLTVDQLRLPAVFLSILRHFIDCIHNQPSQYYPRQYLDLLRWGKYPLGCRDPLNSIHDLCVNLNKVWTHRESIKLHEFVNFSFQGLGILQGKRANSNDRITLIAYCGGYTKRGKCGYPDLILGTEGTKECPNCHHLICPKCGYCWGKCALCQPRQNKLRQSQENLNDDYSPQNHGDSKNAFGPTSYDDDITW